MTIPAMVQLHLEWDRLKKKNSEQCLIYLTVLITIHFAMYQLALGKCNKIFVRYYFLPIIFFSKFR